MTAVVSLQTLDY